MYCLQLWLNQTLAKGNNRCKKTNNANRELQMEQGNHDRPTKGRTGQEGSPGKIHFQWDLRLRIATCCRRRKTSVMKETVCTLVGGPEKLIYVQSDLRKKWYTVRARKQDLSIQLTSKPKEVLFFPRGPPAGRPRGARGWPADEFCYFDGIAKSFFG